MLTYVRPDVYYVVMEFLSPTAFGPGTWTCPCRSRVPSFIVGSAGETTSPPPERRICTELPDVVRTNVAISAHRLRTEWHDLGSS